MPPENIDAMLKVRDAVNIPLATGERIYTKWGFRELFEKQVVEFVQPDICHAGGILELKKLAAMAETYYLGFCPHNPYGPINTLAAARRCGFTELPGARRRSCGLVSALGERRFSVPEGRLFRLADGCRAGYRVG